MSDGLTDNMGYMDAGEESIDQVSPLPEGMATGGTDWSDQWQTKEDEAEQVGVVNLEEILCGCSLQTRSIGFSRRMTEQQREKMAKLFAADSESVRGSREIVLRSHPLVQAVRKPLGKAVRLWKEYTVAYAEGVRLIRTERIEWMNAEISKLQLELQAAAKALREGWQTVKDDAKERLAELYIEEDYGQRPDLEFGIFISYPAIKPDDRLKDIAPEVYEQERQKIAAKFQEAAELAEAAMMARLQELVDNLLDKLQPTPDGQKAKRLSKAGVEALVEFADRFQEFSVSGSKDLNQLVATVKQVATGVDFEQLKKGEGKEALKDKLAAASQSVAKLIENAPKRGMYLDDEE